MTLFKITRLFNTVIIKRKTVRRLRVERFTYEICTSGKRNCFTQYGKLFVLFSPLVVRSQLCSAVLCQMFNFGRFEDNRALCQRTCFGQILDMALFRLTKVETLGSEPRMLISPFVLLSLSVEKSVTRQDTGNQHISW